MIIVNIKNSSFAKEALLRKAGIIRTTANSLLYREIFGLNYDVLMKRVTDIRQRLRKRGFDTSQTSLAPFAREIGAGKMDGGEIDEIIGRMVRDRAGSQ